MNNKLALSIKGALYIFLCAAACVLLAEWLARSGSPSLLVQWAVGTPKHFLLNILLVFFFLSSITALAGRLVAGLIVGSTLLSAAAAINALKLSALQAPFFSWDLLYTRQMLALGQAIISGFGYGWILAALLPFGVIGAWRLCRVRSLPVALKGRIALLMLSVCGLYAFHLEGALSLPRLLQVENIVWEQRQNYERNGFYLAFAMNLSPLMIRQPDVYNEALVARLLEHNEALDKNSEGYAGQPVSLIILMSESFSELSGLSFTTSENPWENLQRLSAQYPRFQIISPTVGGNTSLVELEALTGLTHALLPSGAIPYDHYMNRQVPSIASMLREKGWHTVALHPFHGWFWNRTIAYDLLGFDRYLSLDDFHDAEVRGWFVSDKSLVDKLIEVIESSEGPYFLHAVSMQNHGPYNIERYEEGVVTVEGDMPPRLLQALSTYLTGVRDADRQLARLLRYLESRPEPVICLFFGDHQPALGWELLPYKNPVPSDLEVDFQMAEVPGLLWANKPDLLDAEDIPKSFSPSHLPGILLHQMGVALPRRILHMRQGMQDFPVIHRRFALDDMGLPSKPKTTAADHWLKGLEVLQYDVLFGKSYSSSSDKGREISNRDEALPAFRRPADRGRKRPL